MFIPGNKYAVVGAKGGTLEILDVRSVTCINVVEVHGGSVHSIAATPDGTGGFITGSADNDIFQHQVLGVKVKPKVWPGIFHGFSQSFPVIEWPQTACSIYGCFIRWRYAC
ncbi:unnamed protein product [Cuscuta europaea]|uniref:Uncharacterized protein n=1 Tax=Cuscuta europaea TaxID=41803 RepID=A0A9P0ZPY4_CUSEU|nr:unnamed protein product [Cuscuta europaea]